MRLALVACEVAVGAARDTTATLRVLLGLDGPTRRIGDLQLGLKGLGFPPADLQQTLPQQLMLLRAAQSMRPHLEGLDRDRIGVFVGTDIDPAGARHGCRWRLEQFLGRPCREAERDAVVPALQAAGVVGTMPNMPANRLNSALDARGPGMVVSDGFASGRQALELAADAISRGELDAALVGAVDASGGAFGDDPSRADTAVLLLLLPARSAGTREVLATFTATSDDTPTTTPTLPWSDAGAAHELLQLAVAALCCRHALSPASPADPWIAADRHLRMHGWEIRAPRVQGLAEEAPRLPEAAADEGPADGNRQTADEIPANGSRQPADRTGAVRPASEVAWVFTGAAAAYPGAGRQLLRAFPELGSALRAMAPRLASLLPALMGQSTLTLIDQLQLATMVSQAHAQLLRRVGLVPGGVPWPVERRDQRAAGHRRVDRRRRSVCRRLALRHVRRASGRRLRNAAGGMVAGRRGDAGLALLPRDASGGRDSFRPRHPAARPAADRPPRHRCRHRRRGRGLPRAGVVAGRPGRADQSRPRRALPRARTVCRHVVPRPPPGHAANHHAAPLRECGEPIVCADRAPLRRDADRAGAPHRDLRRHRQAGARGRRPLLRRAWAEERLLGMDSRDSRRRAPRRVRR